MSSAAPRETTRLPELDSLRGVAAFTVVLHHFGLMWPQWLHSVDGPGVHGLRLGLLYPLYAGHEAVMLFFVLSGLVLALPYIHGTSQPYPVYVGRRVLRIYGPYLVALVLAVSGAAFLHGSHSGWAAPFWSQPVSAQLVWKHVLFIGDYDWHQFNFVIWSLIYEMRISILFPVLCLLILRIRPAFALLLAVCCSGFAITFTSHLTSFQPGYSFGMTFHYIAFFILGILVARHLRYLRAWFAGLGRPARAVLVLASFAAYTLSARIAIHFPFRAAEIAGDWGVALGVLGYIVLALSFAPLRRALNSAFPAYLGRISFSLYLVHAPVLLALTFGLGARLSAWQQFPIYLAATFLIATLFNKAVERPFIAAGRRLGRIRPPVASQSPGTSWTSAPPHPDSA